MERIIVYIITLIIFETAVVRRSSFSSLAFFKTSFFRTRYFRTRYTLICPSRISFYLCFNDLSFDTATSTAFSSLCLFKTFIPFILK